MGSTGSGSFSDYSRRKPTEQGMENGGSSGVDQCGQAFSTNLEEVTRCFYYLNKSSLPPSGTDVQIVFNGLRLAVETLVGEEIGYLPAKYNYVKICIDNGMNYGGVISRVRVTAPISITVDIQPL